MPIESLVAIAVSNLRMHTETGEYVEKCWDLCRKDGTTKERKPSWLPGRNAVG